VDLDDVIGSLLLALFKIVVPCRSIVFLVFQLEWLSCGLKTRVGMRAIKASMGPLLNKLQEMGFRVHLELIPLLNN